jgi:hypothetical protein
MNRRRAIASSLGHIDLGEAKSKEVLRVDEPEPILSFSSSEPEETFKTEAEIEEEIKKARENKKINRAPKSAINRLEILTGIGRLVKDVDIDGITFSLRSLKNKETKEVIEAAALSATNVGEALTIRKATLARAIYEIDGVPFMHFLGDVGPEEAIDEMESSVVAKLWKEYSNMILEHKEATIEDLGGEPKEIVENIKK